MEESTAQNRRTAHQKQSRFYIKLKKENALFVRLFIDHTNAISTANRMVKSE